MSKFKGDDAARLGDPESWDEDDIAYLRDRGMLPAGFSDDIVIEADDDGFQEDFDSMRKPQLQSEARSRGIDDGGTVDELRDRLREFDDNAP